LRLVYVVSVEPKEVFLLDHNRRMPGPQCFEDLFISEPSDAAYDRFSRKYLMGKRRLEAVKEHGYGVSAAKKLPLKSRSKTVVVFYVHQIVQVHGFKPSASTLSPMRTASLKIPSAEGTAPPTEFAACKRRTMSSKSGVSPTSFLMRLMI
jgi:hypothetical protein